MMRVVIVWLVLTATFTKVASGQSESFLARLDPSVLAVLAPVFADAARDSLPLSAMEAKALEGLVKGYEPEVVATVLTGMAADLKATRGVLSTGLKGRPLRDGELVASVLARSQGVPDDVIVGLIRDGGGGAMEIPVTVLGELVRRGIPVDDAAWVVGHVARNGVAMTRIAQIPGRFDAASARRGGGRPALLEALQSLGIPRPGRRPPGPPGKSRN